MLVLMLVDLATFNSNDALKTLSYMRIFDGTILRDGICIHLKNTNNYVFLSSLKSSLFLRK